MVIFNSFWFEAIILVRHIHELLSIFQNRSSKAPEAQAKTQQTTPFNYKPVPKGFTC